jgi:uncharacterized protein YlxW (UPF0749 family)
MKQKILSFLTVSLICFIMGTLFSLHSLSEPVNAPENNALSERMDNLVSTINNLEQEIAAYETIIQNTRDELEAMKDQQQSETLQILQDKLHMAKLRAGLTPVTGPGIIIELDDNIADQRANPTEDPNSYIVHYEDLLGIVSDLKAAGAEAIVINEQRLISTSELRCVGNVILVNTTRIAPPFQIQAIGNPNLMAETVSYGRLDYLVANRFPVTIKTDQTLVLPAYKGELQFKYTTFS